MEPSGELAAVNPIARVSEESEEYEQTSSDVQEQQGTQRFLTDTCKCKLGPGGKPCCLSFSKETIRMCRDNCAELSHNELDLVVMSQVHYLRTVEHQTVPRARSQSSSATSFRPLSTYYMHEVKICRPTFLFLHGISRNRYLRIVDLYCEEGLTPSAHGNRGKLPTNACKFEQVAAVKTYIENYSLVCLSLDACLMLLPSDMSKMYVYRKFRDAATDPVGKRSVG